MFDPYLVVSVWIPPGKRLPQPGQLCVIATRGPNKGLFISTFERRPISDNDLVPYGWRGPGPFQFFGQEVAFWMPITPPALE